MGVEPPNLTNIRGLDMLRPEAGEVLSQRPFAVRHVRRPRYDGHSP
jgi:hypothetical protein